MAEQTARNWSSGDIVTAANLKSIERGVSAMAEEYTPTTWTNGNTVTAAGLNNIEQGIVNAGGIATATLTYSAQNSTPFNLYAPIINETYAEMSGVSEGFDASSNPQTVDILLYNGASYVHIDNTITSMSGDIEEDEDGYYFITGDCAIIISDELSGDDTIK